MVACVLLELIVPLHLPCALRVPVRLCACPLLCLTPVYSLLRYEEREAKPVWWRRFGWLAATDAELRDDPDALAGLSLCVRFRSSAWLPAREHGCAK